MRKLLLIALLIVGCAPFTTSNLQSAKLINKGKWEYTPSVTNLSLEHLESTHYGIQIANGLNEKYNFRLRLERMRFGFSHLSFGLKYKLNNPNYYSSIYLPITFTKYDNEFLELLEFFHIRELLPNNNDNILIQLEPTYINTYNISFIDIYLDIDTSTKVFIPINNSLRGLLLGYSLGFGISLNPSKWIIRPEGSLVVLFTKNNFGVGSPQLSIGLSIYP